MTPDDVVPLHLADVTYPGSHPLAGTDGPVLAFAIRHPEGIVLVDTGIGEGNAWIDENYRPRRRGVREALAAAGCPAAAGGAGPAHTPPSCPPRADPPASAGAPRLHT